jgi:hypothetical protein
MSALRTAATRVQKIRITCMNIKFGVWCAVTFKRIIVSLFYNETISSDRYVHLLLRPFFGCAIAQAVSRRLPTAAARDRAQISSCRICGGQSGTGGGFLRVFRCPPPFLIPPTATHSLSIIRSRYNRRVSDRRTKWTQSHPTQENVKKKKTFFPRTNK